jgi:hypothetical protein
MQITAVILRSTLYFKNCISKFNAARAACFDRLDPNNAPTIRQQSFTGRIHFLAPKSLIGSFSMLEIQYQGLNLRITFNYHSIAVDANGT